MSKRYFLTVLTLHDGQIFVVWVIRVVIAVFIQGIAWEIVQIFEMVVYILDFPLDWEIVLVLY